MYEPRRHPYLLGLSLAALSFSLAGAAHAARFDSSLSLAPAIVYTDNVCLQEGNKQDDWVGTVTPSGSVGVTGKRANFKVSGFVQLNSLTNSQLQDRGCGGGTLDKRDQYSPRLRANGSINLIRNYLKVTFSGRADQNGFNSRLAGADDRLDRRGNANNYYRYNVSPVFSTRLGDIANMNLRYGYDELINDKNKANDSVRESVSVTFKNRGSSQISTGLTARHSEVEYTNDSPDILQRTTTDRQSIRINLGYRFDRRFAVNGNYGWDYNNLQTNNEFDVDDNAWQINLRWTPNRRTSVSLGSGDRFFGKTPRVNISYTRERSSFNLSFDKKITYDRDIRTDDGGTLEEFGVIQSLQSQNPIIDERLTLGYNYSGNNINISVHGHHSDQTRTIDNEQGTFLNLGINVTPYVSSSYSISYLLNWSQDEPRSRIGQESRDYSESWNAGVTLSKPINNNLSFALSYLFTDRSSELENGNYQENRVVATLSITL